MEPGFQSTLPVWGGTKVCVVNVNLREFQSTLPVWGGTLVTAFGRRQKPLFQSTLPVWGGTSMTGCNSSNALNFNPPSPCGEGHRPSDRAGHCSRFQSTLPVWGGTGRGGLCCTRGSISIHPPRVGRDWLSPRSWAGYPADFNPPSPCGEGRLGI